MARGYPSRRRAQAAYARGFNGITGRAPYTNPILVKLWKRGCENRRLRVERNRQGFQARTGRGCR